MLKENRDSSLSGPIEATVVALFGEQARVNAAAPAVRFEGVAWSYAELARRVNRLARLLARRGVARGSMVPLLLRPTPHALEAMLAVMHAGAAYVPLDPAYAPRRITAVLDEIQSPVLLTARGSMPGALPSVGSEVIVLDEADLDGVSDDPVPVASRTGDLAYVIYTSGTTGKPNGVEVTHDGLCNYLLWCVKHYPVHRSAGGSLVHTSIGFDLTVTSLFVPLLTGQRVTFVAGDANNLEPVVAALRSVGERLAFLKMTPSHLRALRHLVAPEDLVRATGTLILGGEQLYAEDLTGFEPYLGGDIRVFNEYGPTETVVGSTCHEVTDLRGAGRIPIGRPIDNTTVYVCDEQMHVLPTGVTGELSVGGRGVARGYYNRDALTASKFVTLHGERVYRTGDLVRFTTAGALEFIGRRDHQVQLRGHRIELAEIESLLKEYDAVAEAVVLLEGERDAARLVAFVVPNVTRRETQTAAGRMIRHSVTPAELHAYLATRMPESLVPPLFVLLDAIPKNAHGKIDRDELLRRAAATPARSQYVPPYTDLQAALAAVYAKVLKIDGIGIDDNYFALGGDSIRSIQVAGEAQVRGIKLSVGDIHRFPTIRLLAEHLAGQRQFEDMPKTRPFDLISKADRDRMPPDVEDAYPLNLLQEGMIYHRAFAAKSAVYHAMLSLVLKAPFDLAALSHVVQELVNRHPLLRTSFDQHSFSIPLQLVRRTFKDPLHFIDLQGQPAEEQQASIARWIQEEKERGFAVDEYPLIRFMVHRLGEDTFRLTFSYHHEIIDGWSESTMVTELLTQYLSIVNNEPVRMTAPNASFRDSILLEQRALQSEEFRTFWERTLDGANFMRLPRLLSGPKADKGQREIVKLHFPFADAASDGIKRLALTLGVPLKSVLLAGHMKVMGLFGGSADVVTHTVSNGRPENPDGARLIGLFVNSFTFRQRLAHGSWRDLILNTLKLEQDSIPYRRYPMAELKRHQGRDPLSETLFFLIDYHVYHQLERWDNAKLLHYEVYGESTFPFCATFRVNHFTSQLDMQIEYDSLQFPRELIDAIADAYSKVYAAMMANPSDAHQVFSLTSPRGMEQEAPGAASEPGCVHAWIEDQVDRAPDAVALVSDRHAVTYGELSGRANQLARWLRQHGIGRETTVALFLERSPELVIAMLAVLKAGAAYIPLDPDHRGERIRTILDEARPALVLTRGALRHLVPAGLENVCSIDAVLEEARRNAPTNLGIAVAPENVAYVIFTSGSTGTPKGVMVPHAALVSSTAARQSVFDRRPDRFLLLSSQAFDSSVAGLYWTLCTGSTLVLPPGNGPLDLNQALSLTRRDEITHTLCIPSFYGSMVESAREGELATLQTVIVAGEECRSEVWEQHKAACPSVSFYNEYGPSEATVWTTVWKGDPAVARASLPIGRAIPGAAAFVLDGDGHVTPTGVVGELCLGGANVSRGYLANPAATAERFSPDPFATAAGARLYRSGDLSRVTRSGEIEYVGRIDHQIKVRGFRIEPTEIESVLEMHARVKRAVVVARQDQSRDKVLVAYIVPAVLGELAPADVATFAKDKLPKYLIPSSFVMVEALPLTATGKLDRNALPSADAAIDRAAEPIAPRTPTEEAIAGIWSRVLGLDAVSVLDDFFALGGESLRAMRILSQIRKSFDVELPIASLIHTEATVAALAEAVDSALWLRSHPEAPMTETQLQDVVM